MSLFAFPLICCTFFTPQHSLLFSSCSTLSNFSIHSNHFLKLYVLHERIRHRGVGKRGKSACRISIFYASTSSTSASLFLYPLVLLSLSFFSSCSKEKMDEKKRMTPLLTGSDWSAQMLLLTGILPQHLSSG